MILIGDINQLQPISWGALMIQLEMSRRVPVFRLTHSHRIARSDTDSVVLMNANSLILRQSPDIPVDFKSGPGFKQISGTIDTVRKILEIMYTSGVAYTDVTIITPYKESAAQLNPIFQSIWFTSELSMQSRLVDAKAITWILGDRVMMKVNNYEIDVMNGEEGIVTGIDDESVTVTFLDGGEHKFFFSRAGDSTRLYADSIAHSYAITAHKSQGSEYPYVVVFIPKRGENEKTKFLNSNLLYMMLTRTMRAVWLVGDTKVIAAATTRFQPKRVDRLGFRLNVTKNHEAEMKISHLCMAQVIDEDEYVEEPRDDTA